MQLKNVLIESDWNLKVFLLTPRHGLLRHVLIESDWNLKICAILNYHRTQECINRIRLEFKVD